MYSTVRLKDILIQVGIRALLLAPTRELAEQIFREALRLCTGRNIRIGILKKASVSAAIHQEVRATVSPLHRAVIISVGKGFVLEI